MMFQLHMFAYKDAVHIEMKLLNFSFIFPRFLRLHQKLKRYWGHRSTQTQLLSHFNDIFDTLAEGKRLDTVYLDFAKVFDKVDHEILLEKVKKTQNKR